MRKSAFLYLKSLRIMTYLRFLSSFFAIGSASSRSEGSHRYTIVASRLKASYEGKVVCGVAVGGVSNRWFGSCFG